MKQIIFTLFIVCIYNTTLAQTNLSKIRSLRDAETFIETNPALEGKLFSIKSGEDAAEILSPLLEQKAGYTFTIGKYTYKLIDFDSTLSFRANYIYLDGSKFSKEEIDQKRKDIIAAYKAGTNFTDLVTRFNMDGNTTGDTHWFSEGMMVAEFEAAVKAHKKGDIFTVDTPKLNWYHVVLKTDDATYKKNFTLLKVKVAK